MFPMAFCMADKDGTDYVALGIGAAIGFASSVLVFWIQHLVSKHNEAIKDAKNLKHLLFVFTTEISSAQDKVTQYVRQVVIGMRSKSRLTTFLGRDQIWDAARLGARTKAVNALYDIYNLYELIHHQIDKVSAASSEADKWAEFAPIYTFVKNRFPRFKDAVNIVFDRATETNRAQVLGTKLVRACSWIGSKATELVAGKLATDEENYTTSIEECRVVTKVLLDECEQWFERRATMDAIDTGFVRLKGQTEAYLKVRDEVMKTIGPKKVLEHLIGVFSVLLHERGDDREQFTGMPFRNYALVGNMIASIDDREPRNEVGYVKWLLPQWEAKLPVLS